MENSQYIRGLSKNYAKLVGGVYPITYYFIGCYLHEYGCKLSKKKNLVLLLIAILCFGSFNYYRSYGNTFLWGEWQNWGALPNVIMTVLLFTMILNFDTTNFSIRSKRIWKRLSDLCLGAYLVSYIFDRTFYEKLNTFVPDMLMRLNYYVIIVPLVCVCSILLSFVLNKIYEGIAYMVVKTIHSYQR